MDDPNADFFLCDYCQRKRAYARMWRRVSYRQTDLCLECLPNFVEAHDAGSEYQYIRLETEVDRAENRYAPTLTVVEVHRGLKP